MIFQVKSTLIFCFLFVAYAVQSQPKGIQLNLIDSIEIPHVKGRLDHMSYDPVTQLLYVAAYQMTTAEVIDLKNRKHLHIIRDQREPQCALILPKAQTLIITNGRNGECGVYNANTLQKKLSVQLEDDADNIQFDSIENKIYVGYGSGGIAVIDAAIYKVITKIPLAAHPESFQIDRSSKRMYVNVPDAHLVEVIDLSKNEVIDKWKMNEAQSNYPMALDESNQRLFIGCRYPAKLLVLNSKNGDVIQSLDIDRDVDDIFFDAKSKLLYLSCGEGSIYIFRQKNQDLYILESRIPTRKKARTSLLIPETNQFILAVPGSVSSAAKIFVYEIVNK